MPKYFTTLEELKDFVREKDDSHLVVGHYLVPGYEGMVLYIGIRFKVTKNEYNLNFEWMCWGLDFYGDTLQESYSYKFDDLDKLLNYLDSKYNIKVTDLADKYEIELCQFPDPLKNADQKPVFEEAWARFQADFKENKFLDPSLKLIYSSLTR